MATPLSPDKMMSALKNEGVKVSQQAGWKTHNRNHKGAWGPVNGIIIHHTAGADSSGGLSLVYNGRSDLPGPLAHAYLGKTGTVTLTANGRANHAGLGDSKILDAVVKESYTSATALKPRLNDTDGNAHFYGIEIANLGNGKDPYPAVQYDAAVRWAAAICRAHGWSAKSVIGHKEWTNQKIDPSFSMVQFRKDVAARLKPAQEPAPTKPPATPAMPRTVSSLPLSTPTWEGGPFQIDISKQTTSVLEPEFWYDVAFATETWDENNQFTVGDHRIAGNGTYSGQLNLRLTDVAEGDEIQIRLVERDAAGTTVKIRPIMEGLGSQGGTYLSFPINGLLPYGRTLGFQIANYTAANVTLEYFQVSVQWWVREI